MTNFIDNLIRGTSYYYIRFVILYLCAILCKNVWGVYCGAYISYLMFVNGANYATLCALLLQYKEAKGLIIGALNQAKLLIGKELMKKLNRGLYFEFLFDLGLITISLYFHLPFWISFLATFHLFFKLLYSTMLELIK